MDGTLEDLDPVEQLQVASGVRSDILYYSDQFAEPCMPVGKRLTETAEAAKAAGDYKQAKELYLRGCNSVSDRSVPHKSFTID